MVSDDQGRERVSGGRVCLCVRVSETERSADEKDFPR